MNRMGRMRSTSSEILRSYADAVSHGHRAIFQIDELTDMGFLCLHESDANMAALQNVRRANSQVK